MELKGINTQVTNNTMRDALKRAGIKIRKSTKSWPRRRGPAAVRVDCSNGYSGWMSSVK